MKKSAVVHAVCVVLALSIGSAPSASQGQSGVSKIKLVTTETDYGKRLEMVDSSGNDFVFSPNLKRLAYWIYTPKSKNYKMSVALDGVSGKGYDYTSVPNPRAGNSAPPGEIIFSPDSRHIAYRALRDNNWMVVQDGRESRLYPEREDDLYEDNGRDVIDDIVWSPDSRHLAYRARRGKKWRVVRDGKEGKPYDWIADNDLHFSRDSKRLAYWAKRGGQNFIVLLDGAKVKETRFTPKVTAKPQSAPQGGAKPRYAKRGDKLVVVWNGRDGKPYDDVDSLIASSDGRHIAYWARRDGEWFVVVDEVEGKSYRDGAGPNSTNMLEYDGVTVIYNLDPLVFDGPDSLYTTALGANGHIIRVQIRIVNE